MVPIRVERAKIALLAAAEELRRREESASAASAAAQTMLASLERFQRRDDAAASPHLHCVCLAFMHQCGDADGEVVIPPPVLLRRCSVVPQARG